jgi:hypothetical protein
MAFQHLPAAASRDQQIQRVFQHASAYLADVYTMLGAAPPANSNGGRCNFSIAVVLSCVIDGLATEIHPILPPEDQFERMRALVLKMRWGSKSAGWITPLEAAKVLYTEIRNPLVHNLGADTRPRVRRPGFRDAAVVHEMVDGATAAPDEIERMQEWPEQWPVMWAKTSKQPGPKRIVVSVAALYWHVKELATRLAYDDDGLRQTLELRKRRRVRDGRTSNALTP